MLLFPKVDISSPSKTYMLVFEGMVGDPSVSDMAIDDILLTPGQCQGKPLNFTCPDNTTISPDKVCHQVSSRRGRIKYFI